MTLLGKPALYERQILELRDAGVRFSNSEPPFPLLFEHRRRIARQLARGVSRDRYAFAPLRERHARIDGKSRTLYVAASLLDRVVLGAVSRALADAIEPALPAGLYSYRRGRSSWRAIEALCSYIRAHRARHPDPRERGLYVIRRDVRRYGDSIPVADDSALWPTLRAAVGDTISESLLRRVFRPTIRFRDDSIGSLSVGVPSGSPVQVIACNLYLTPVDDALGDIDGAFYARFGDDILFAHPQPETTKRAARELDRLVTGLGLQTKPSASSDVYFTAAGRASSAWPECRASAHVEYLGGRIDFTGGVGLKNDKARRLILHLRRRLRHAHRLLAVTETHERTRALCHIANRALDPSCPFAEPAAAMLRQLVDDRGQLAQLDYLIALEIAQLCARRRGPRAFRTVPYRQLRRDGLTSLVAQRDRGDRS